MTSKTSGFLLRTLLVLGLLAAVSYYFLIYSRPIAKVVAVRAGMSTDSVPGSVTVRVESQEIKCEYGGRVAAKKFVKGQAVKKGDVLLQLDTDEIDLQIKIAESNAKTFEQKRVFEEKMVELNWAAIKEGLDNAERMFKRGMKSEAEFTEEKRKVEKLQQQREIDKISIQNNSESIANDLAAKKLQKQKMSVRAPFDGEIAEDYSCTPGALIGPGTPIAKLIALDRIIEAKISEENAAGVKVGKKASVTFLPYGAWQFPAKVVKKFPAADPETQRYTFELEVQPDPERPFVPGYTGEVTIVIDEHPSETIIPRSALFNDQVFVVKDGRVQLRKVKKGYVALNFAEIREGVAKGEVVIVDQLDQFRDGDRVKAELVK
ncbi:MAG: efflux RND transporter periplasmic adaptor subunit [Opitutae bacterium]|nr:efflux RND transporter periplasmic adaptor subunit [Opitutae bacterium]